jgi:rod shape-determining protein MreD
MKKLLIYFIIYLAVLIMQFGWTKYISPYGISPNLMLVCLVFIGLTRGPLEGEILGFAWGISWDAMSTEMFGSHAFLFMCLGYFAGLLSRQWDESKVFAQMALVGIASLVFMIGMKTVYAIFGANEYVYCFNYITNLQPFYNMLITPLVFLIGKGIISILD